jgi:AraC-like DNA-binding protein
MWYDVAWAPSFQPAAGMALMKLYEVKADGSYDIHSIWPQESPFIAIRTLAGRGIIDLATAGSFQLEPDTLMVTPSSQIKRYRCSGRSWHFWWLEFQPMAGLPLPVGTMLPIGVSRHELSCLKACFADLRSNGSRFQGRASSRLVFLMHDWAAEWSEAPTPQTRNQAAIQRVVQLMHSHLHVRLDLPEMARTAGLSERRFRQVFNQLTGKSPKRFHEELRLRKAADYLRFHAMNVSEIADEFGYSSPFHFSKAFRSLFGISPLRYLRKRSEMSNIAHD